jgi:ABC-type uncharacterized transport system permease subunit
MTNVTKHIWIFLSAYGVCFAALSFGQEIVTKGLWWKGIGALILGFILYKIVIHKI